MKREAFFAECLSFAMKAPPQKGAKQPPPFDVFPPNTVPPVLGGYTLMWLQGEETTGSL